MIQVRDVHKSYGEKAVLRGMTFSVGTGEIYGLLGPNGAGKTTMISILCGLLDADAGEAWIQDSPVTGTSKVLVGVVSQESSVYRDLTVRENLAFFASLYGVRGDRQRGRIDEVTAQFDLSEYLHTPVFRLSGGWQRRVNIAVALVHSPPIVILDEPTAGLDVEARFELWQVIQKLRGTGAAILLSTHQFDEAERLCTRFGILRHGRIVRDGSLKALRETVPARQLAVISSDAEEQVLALASAFGWETRRYDGRLTLLLPERLTLPGFVDRFNQVELTSVTLQEVGLEHVYVESMREDC